MSVALASPLSFSAREVIVIIMRLMLLEIFRGVHHILGPSAAHSVFRSPFSVLHSYFRHSPPLALSQNDLELPFSVYLKIIFHIPLASTPEMEGRSPDLFREQRDGRGGLRNSSRETADGEPHHATRSGRVNRPSEYNKAGCAKTTRGSLVTCLHHPLTRVSRFMFDFSPSKPSQFPLHHSILSSGVPAARHLPLQIDRGRTDPRPSGAHTSISKQRQDVFQSVQSS